eukprot:2963262-Amphidinium_carterae.1
MGGDGDACRVFCMKGCRRMDLTCAFSHDATRDASVLVLIYLMLDTLKLNVRRSCTIKARLQCKC